MKYVVLQISLPPIMNNTGTYAAEISWKVRPETWNPAKFNITVVNPIPRIKQLTPISASQQAGTIFEFLIFSLPAVIDRSSIFAALDGSAVNISSAALADPGSLQISIKSPGTNSCHPILSVEYLSHAYSYLAQAAMLFISPDPVAVCILGCSKSVDTNELQLAVVTLQSKLFEKFDSVANLKTSCVFSVDQTSSSVYTCTAVFLHATQIQNCAHNSQLFCANVSVLYGIESDSVAELNGTLLKTKVPGYIRIFLPSFSNLCVLASVSFYRGPSLLNASFTSDFSCLAIWFNQDLQVLQSNAECSILFKSTSKFGVDPICIWGTPSNLNVFLGHNASLAPFDQVTLLGPFQSLNSITMTNSNLQFQVLPPLQIMLPKTSVVGPKTISSCDTG